MKNLKALAALTAFTTIISISPVAVFAAPKEKSFSLPANAQQVSDDVYSLGSAIDPATGDTVEGFAFIHRKNEKVKTSGGGARTAPCYAYLADGAKWKGTPESWIMNPMNIRGLDQTTAFSVVMVAISKWEDAADGTVGNATGVDVMGAGTQTISPLSAETTAPDGNNEVYFGSIAENGVIAVTTVWGTFGGPVKNRKLVEWDMVIDQTDYNWSFTGLPNTMDLDNIVTHEIGHAFGMDHPGNTCTDETMYAYANYGETNKRTLNAGDITGINLLY